MGIFGKKKEESLEERDANKLSRRSHEVQAEIDGYLNQLRNGSSASVLDALSFKAMLSLTTTEREEINRLTPGDAGEANSASPEREKG